MIITIPDNIHRAKQTLITPKLNHNDAMTFMYLFDMSLLENIYWN